MRKADMAGKHAQDGLLIATLDVYLTMLDVIVTALDWALVPREGACLLSPMDKGLACCKQPGSVWRLQLTCSLEQELLLCLLLAAILNTPFQNCVHFEDITNSTAPVQVFSHGTSDLRPSHTKIWQPLEPPHCPGCMTA